MITRALVPQSYYIYILLREDPEAAKIPFLFGLGTTEVMRGNLEGERGRTASFEEYTQQYDMYFTGIGTAGTMLRMCERCPGRPCGVGWYRHDRGVGILDSGDSHPNTSFLVATQISCGIRTLATAGSSIL